MANALQSKDKLEIPWASLILIGLNLIAAFVSALDRDFALEYSFAPERPDAIRAFLSLFLHTNIIHLAGNMVFLAAVGPRVESVAGRFKMLAIYLVGGLFGVVAHWVVMTGLHSESHLVGASGAISSLAGYCAIRFMSKKVPLAPRIQVPVHTVLLFWILLQALGAFIKIGQQEVGGTAFWSHLAGFLVGMILGFAFGAQKSAKLQFGHETLEIMSRRGPAATVQAALKHLENHPQDAAALRELALAYYQMGDNEHAFETQAHLIQISPKGSFVTSLSTLEEWNGLSTLEPMERLKYSDQTKDVDRPLAIRLAQSVVNDREASKHRPDALLSLAGLLEGQKRQTVLSELFEQYPTHPASDIARQRGWVQ